MRPHDLATRAHGISSLHYMRRSDTGAAPREGNETEKLPQEKRVMSV